MAGTDWMSIAISAIGSYADSKEKSSQSKKDSKEARKTIGYQAELLDYYDQLNKDRNRKSLANFSKWASPTSRGDYYSPALSDKPTADGKNMGGG
jgi:hypothetical protein